ncbi:MAG: hypothetical protein ACRC50_14230 [Gaiella sp.]
MNGTADPRLAIPGLHGPGVDGAKDGGGAIRGSTTILELLRMYPDGRAARLLAAIQFPCAHCGGAVREPLSLAARRHRRDPRAVLDAFRALAADGPTTEQVDAARVRCPERWPAAVSRHAAASGRAPQ